MAWPSSFTTPPAGSGPQGHNDAHSELIAAVQDLDSRVNSGVTDHDDLTGRDAADQHPIGAVTGLQSALDDKANTSALGSAAFAPTSAFDPAGAASSAVSAFAGTLGTAAGADTGDFATATQGAKADSAVQPADLTPYATDADLSTHASDTTAVHGIADTSALVTDDDSRLSDARTPTAHTHDVGDIDATGTPSDITYLRGDGRWATPAGGGGGASTLDDLTDVDTTGATTGDTLTYDGTTWVADAPSAGTVTSTSISDSTATGRAVLTAADAATARTAIGAGTSSFDGAYSSLSGRPTLGTAAAANTGDFATATQGAKADSAVQPADLTPYATDADLSTHASDTTAVHGIADTSALVTDDDSRLSDARTPTAHAASHADGGADEVSIHASQVTDGVFNIARLATGTPDGTKFIRDDGTLAVPAGGGLSGVGVSTVWAGSQAAYDAIGTPDPNTLYFVTG